ncbi:MAG: mechanosensitive ion channel [Nanoarchaeota archaeon]|nr:mechanosensitive ion channel [Nanoarchaeota archaeon]MBU1135520.1 mechanosensitive ion channel [Nanoarchaeota archaeon]MBU2520408.1 mechanosensitive ion channel [Nanoarchaeota archaeon]
MSFNTTFDLQAITSDISVFFANFTPNYIIPNLKLITQILLMLLFAYIVGRIGKAITVKILSMIGLKKSNVKSMTDNTLKAIGYGGSVVDLIGDLVKWFIYLIFLGVIIETLGLPQLFIVFNTVAFFIPRVIGAILIIVIGFIVADFMGGAFGEAAKKFFQDEFLASVAGGLIKYSIAMIVIIMGLAIIGIETMALLILFAFMLLASTIIFTLGMKDMFPNFTAGVHLKRVLKIGEHVKIGEYSGIVENIGAVSVTLDSNGKKVNIPNAILVNNPIERKNKK